MKGKIAFEEHMAIPETTDETRDFAGESSDFDQFTREILDLDDIRLGYMDDAGIEVAILSLNAPGVQRILDTDEAIETARKGNEAMAAAVARHATRYRAMAALPMQDPQAAAAELERCVKELGFVGALVNGLPKRTPLTQPSTMTYPSTANSGRPWPTWMCRFTCIRAWGYRHSQRTSWTSPGCVPRLGALPLKPVPMP